MRKVSLPKDSPRGGVLAHASVLLVTSNPTRTSPVKRGQFILENMLGTPAPPPPAVVPPLEDSKKEFKDREPTGRELLAMHRAQPLCSSCHARMDPLGLALENFNAMGLWRDKERGQPIDSTGKADQRRVVPRRARAQAHPQGEAQGRISIAASPKNYSLMPWAAGWIIMTSRRWIGLWSGWIGRAGGFPPCSWE